MGQTKHLIDERFEAKMVKNAKKGRKQATATYIDVKPDEATRKCILAYMHDHEDIFEDFAKAFMNPQFQATVKLASDGTCYQLAVCDKDLKWGENTYFIFRHSNIMVLWAMAVYVINEQWQGSWPVKESAPSEYDW